MTPVPHTYAIGWSPSSLGTWHLGLLPTPCAILPNHGGVGPAANIAALSDFSLPRLDKLQLAFGQMTQAGGLRLIRLVSVRGATWLSTVLVGFAVQDESKQTRQLTNESQQQSTLVLVAQRQYLFWTSQRV
jgi:hypothetical protein